MNYALLISCVKVTIDAQLGVHGAVDPALKDLLFELEMTATSDNLAPAEEAPVVEEAPAEEAPANE